MTNILIKKFIKNYDDVKNPAVRGSYGKLGSIIGIIANAFLCTSKILIGLIFNSVSITADGINNLSDAGSSLITLIGFKMAGKPADEDHPFGHARIEYISGFIVAFIILILGVELIKTSFDKILHPEPIKFNIIMILVLGFSILLKIWLSLFNKKLADIISSTAMKATAMDSLNDVYATSVVLISVLVSKFTNLQIDGYMGILVALFIVYSGINIIREIMNPLLGELPDSDLTNKIQKKILEYEGVLNIHDLVVHNYGPNKYFATVHVEVDYKEDIMKSHDMIDNIERDFLEDSDINLVIHLDPVVTDDKETNELKDMTNNIVISIHEKMSIHDFRVVKGTTHTNLIFDVLVPVECKILNKEIVSIINKKIKEKNITFFPVITIDKNYVSICINKPDMK